MQDLIDINNLSYLSDTDASVAVQRQQIELTPPKTKYDGGSKIIFKLRGISFRDFQNSAYIFKLTRTGLSAATFSLGESAMNTISRVVVSSSNGQTVSDVENVNLYDTHKSQIDQSLEYTTLVGASYGYDPLGTFTIASGVEYHYSIPMRKLSPFFDTDQLVHPKITDNMTITIYLEVPQVTFAGASGSTYEVNDPKLVIDTTQVSDGIYNELNKMGSKGQDSLVYEYYDVTHEDSNITANSNVLNYTLGMSVTNAVDAVVLLRTAADAVSTTTSSLHTKGPLVATGFVSTSDNMLWKSGSVSLPKMGAKNGVEIYNTLLSSQNVLADKSANRFRLSIKDFNARFGCYMVDLRRSRMFRNSGREISNNQGLSVKIEQATPADYVADIFVTHTSRIVIADDQMTIQK